MAGRHHQRLGPLGRGRVPHPTIDDRHGNAALVAYLSIAALAAWGLRRNGHGRLAAASVVAGVASILLLAAAFDNSYVGLLQRTGAGIGNAWTVLAALALLRRPRTTAPT